MISLLNSFSGIAAAFAGLLLLNNVLIVGSGAGNDVAAANRFNIQNVSAVEIDPVIAELGKKLHLSHQVKSKTLKRLIRKGRAEVGIILKDKKPFLITALIPFTFHEIIFMLFFIIRKFLYFDFLIFINHIIYIRNQLQNNFLYHQ